MNYNLEFKEVAEHCEKNELFLGFGNPNGKVLMIGKEQAYNNKQKVGTPEFIKEVIENRRHENQTNNAGWRKNLDEHFIPDWENMPFGFVNPLYSWGSQLNIGNKLKLNDSGEKIGNGGTSNTYLKYQKFYQFLKKQDVKSDKINFQKDFFMTEMNDFPTKYSYADKELAKIRAHSIEMRKELFQKDFFKTFPITIINAGHYPIEHGFDIEKIFEVKFTGETKTVGNLWYNVHYSDDNRRILIHTRQLSMAVTDELLENMAIDCRSFF